MRLYIDEFIESPSFENIVIEIIKLHTNGKSVEDISRELEKNYYIFNDDTEHLWNMEVVNNIINNRPIKNRFTGYVFQN